MGVIGALNKSWGLPDMFKTPAVAPVDTVIQPPTVEEIRVTPKLGAAGKANGSTDSKSKEKDPYGLPTLDIALDDQAGLMLERQEAELAAMEESLMLTQDATRKVAGLNDQAQSAADDVRDSQVEIMSGIDEQIRRANIAIELSDSKNPLDHFKLYMLQQADPSYTDKGNLARIGYYRQAADALGHKGAVEQGYYTDEIARVGRNLGLATIEKDSVLKMLTLAEQQGAQRLEMAKNIEATRLGTLQTQNAMMEAGVVNMTPDQVEAAKAKAIASPSGTANIAGIDYSTQMLTERSEALQEREYLTQIRSEQMTSLTLSNKTLPEIQLLKTQAAASKDGTVTIDNRPVSLARIQEREDQLVNQASNSLVQAFTLEATMENMKLKTDRKILDTMTPTELNTIIKNNGVDGDNQYDMRLVREVRDAKYQDKAADLNERASLMNMGDPMAAPLSVKSQLDSIKAEPNSTLEQVINRNQTQLAWATSLMNPADGSTPSPQDMAAGMAVLQSIQENTAAAITAQAKAKSRGDKNLEQAYEATYRGQAIPEEVVRTAIIEKVIAGKPATEWLDSAAHGILVDTFNAEFQRLKTENVMGNMDKATMELMAGEKAANAVMMYSSAGFQEQVLSSQIQGGKDNPLKAIGMTPGAIVQLTHAADAKGMADFINAYQVDEKTAAGMRQGLVPPEMQSELARYQGAALYAELDKKNPGLGKAYTTWWSSEARTDFIDRFLAGKQSEASTIQQNAGFSLLAPNAQGAMGSYANALASGERLLFESQLAKEHAEYVTFGGDPTTKQVFLLDRDKSLTDSEKQQAMQLVIQPMLQMGQANSWNQEQTTNYIESSLKTLSGPIFENPEARKIAAKMLKNRDASIEILDSFINLSAGRVNPIVDAMADFGGLVGSLGIAGMGRNRDVNAQAAVAKSASSANWYRDMGK